MRVSRGMGMGSAAAEVSGGSKFAELLSELPLWAQSLISILLVIAVAAVAGMVIGKLYAMVKYPDPESNSAVSPKIKVAFICLLALCCWWLFVTMTEEQKAGELPPEDQLPAVMGGSDMRQRVFCKAAFGCGYLCGPSRGALCGMVRILPEKKITTAPAVVFSC